jgi:hypothetical protein
MARKQGYKPISEWSDERKQKHIEYDQTHYSVIGAKLPRDQADSFREICKRNNISVSAALSVFVRACIDCNSLDVIRDDILGQKNIDPAFPQGDQASENDTPGTVDIPENASD